MSKNKKVIIGILIAVLIIVIGVVVAYKIIEKSVTNREDFKFKIENISSNPIETKKVTKKLKENELKEFEDYFNDNENNGFLVATYKTPNEVNLNEVLYVNSIGTELTKEEEKAYMEKTKIDELYTECTKYKKDDINKLLNEKLGLSLNDVTTDFTYLYIEKYDAYYNMHGDTNYLPAKCISGEINEEGLYIIDYEMDNTQRTVTLKENSGKYQFISNINNTQVRIEKEVGDIMLRSNLSLKEVDNYKMYYESDLLCYVVQNNLEYERILYYQNNKCFAVAIIEEDGSKALSPVDNSTGIGNEEYLLFKQNSN